MQPVFIPEHQSLFSELMFEENHKRLGLLADAMPQLFWIAQADGRVVYYNSRVEEFAGAQKDEMGKWSWTGLLHEDDLEATARLWSEAVLTGGVYETEHRLHMKDGSFRWHLSRAFPQKNEKGEVISWFGTATDIHEQKRVEEKIKEAEERWRTALEATEIGTWEFDPGSKRFYLSDVALKIRGLGQEVDRPFVLHRETIHPDDVRQVDEAMQAALDRGIEETFSMEYRVYKKNTDQWCWIRSIGRPLMDPAGRVYRVIGIMQDITERKESEEKLRYLATLTQHIAGAVIGTDSSHHITNWNKGAEEMYGWKEAEVMGKSAQDLLGTQFLSERDEKTWREIFTDKGQWQGEVWQKTKEGQTISVLASIAKVTDGRGQPIGSVAVNKDITAQHQAAQLLKESEARFRLLTNTVPQIIWISTGERELEYLNDQWFQITGQPTEEGLKNRMDMMHPADRKGMEEKWAKALETREAFDAEYRLKVRNSEAYRWFYCKIQPLKNEEGQVVKWIGAASDIQHFKDISVLLNQEVQERTMELHRLNLALQKQAAELQRSNEDLQQFAHVASHDLKEPLRKIKTYGSRLQEEYGALLPEKARTFLDKMDSAATRMSSMIDGVLGYSMLGATEQVTEPVDLNELMTQIEADLEVLIQQKNAKIHYRDLPLMEASGILMYQLFYNLINNSLKFSRSQVDPEIVLSSAPLTEEERRAHFLLPGRAYVSITVKDNGIGFEQQHADRIFKTFTRLNSRDRYEGTGLGLSLCQKIVQRHHGHIRAEGSPQQGSTFHIILPLRQGD
ncbi:MAG: PAS domain-containing sensor histidine kinase [Flavisolibacter sp.]